MNTAAGDQERRALAVEQNGLNTIAEEERHGTPRSLFWPWFAANVSVLGISYGSFVLGFGLSAVQAIIVGVIGTVLSFALCGVISLVGKRGSAPTMVLARPAFGVRGSRVPAVVSWMITVGWETSLVSLAVLATSTVFGELGWNAGTTTKIVSLVVVAALIVGSGIIGFSLIMRLQVIITVITGVLTVVYAILVLGHIDGSALLALPWGGPSAMVGALIFMMTAFGLSWANMAADYSRYLPRRVSSSGVVGWTTLGAALAPVLLLVFGVLLAGSSKQLDDAVAADPVGALTTLLPTWFLVPFAIVAVLGLVGGAVLDIYSSGLALLSAGLPVPRWLAAAVDGVIMIAGSIYIVFFAGDFLGPFQGFLITLGVPIAAWAGVMVADIALRRRDYDAAALQDRNGRYGDIGFLGIVLMIIGTAIGWGLVINSYAPWLGWQGYLLGPFGGRTGDWAFANLGVLAALVIGFVGYLIFGRAAVRRQESPAA
ncbi:purine-cytosine permease family protein [Microlunatus soli]|uniref:Purine-cytosine permease n=1 Tax=Microlunatus soli TaxID=630515 RepID=A0A1H1YXN9_9ACTN|nr:cytosine permease [Microlunatus soli]SDT25706.1 Purine-cytosine permease [Microlunatus soli]